VLGCGLILVAAVAFTVVGKGGASRVLLAAAFVFAALAALSLTSFFREAMTVFMTRWNDASVATGSDSLQGRILGGFLEPFGLMSQVGMFGRGVGLGTSGASALMTGSVQFLLAEGEWSRVIMEAGPLLGFSFLAYRAWLAGDMAIRALAATRQQNLLAWLLAWDACRSLINEQLSQPTNLGFMVLVGGLCLAAMPARGSVPAEKPAGESARHEYGRLRFESQLSR
jgi:hypothetical protein